MAEAKVLTEESVAPKRVIFFDGECSLCNGWVDFVMKRDPAGQFHFASLQSGAARELLPAELVREDDLDSLVLLKQDAEGSEITLRSSAALTVLGLLPFPWSLAKILKIIPAFIRDAVYRLVAKNRYRWFGRRDSCRLPTPEERARFLEHPTDP